MKNNVKIIEAFSLAEAKELMERKFGKYAKILYFKRKTIQISNVSKKLFEIYVDVSGNFQKPFERTLSQQYKEHESENKIIKFSLEDYLKNKEFSFSRSFQEELKQDYLAFSQYQKKSITKLIDDPDVDLLKNVIISKVRLSPLGKMLSYDLKKNVILVYGASGSGKSQFILRLLNKFFEKLDTRKILVLRSKKDHLLRASLAEGEFESRVDYHEGTCADYINQNFDEEVYSFVICELNSDEYCDVFENIKNNHKNNVHSAFCLSSTCDFDYFLERKLDFFPSLTHLVLTKFEYQRHFFNVFEKTIQHNLSLMACSMTSETKQLRFFNRDLLSQFFFDAIFKINERIELRESWGEKNKL